MSESRSPQFILGGETKIGVIFYLYQRGLLPFLIYLNHL